MLSPDSLHRLFCAVVAVLSLITYIAYNAADGTLHELHELTKWTWLVHTGFFFVATGMPSKSENMALLLVWLLGVVLGAEVMVAAGVTMLIYSDSELFGKYLREYPSAAVLTVNFVEHFLTLFLTLTSLLVWWGLWKREYRRAESQTTSAALLVTAFATSLTYLVIYLSFLDPNSVYGISLNLSMLAPFASALLLLSQFILFRSLQ